jgi:hypothetical protein
MAVRTMLEMTGDTPRFFRVRRSILFLPNAKAEGQVGHQPNSAHYPRLYDHFVTPRVRFSHFIVFVLLVIDYQCSLNWDRHIKGEEKVVRKTVINY